MNRRTFLNAAAASVLAGQANSLSAKTKLAKSSKNLVVFVSAYGFNDKHYLPQGDDLESSTLIKMLSKHYNDMTVFNKTGQSQIGAGHSNHRGLLSLNKAHSGANMTSLDRFAADRLEQTARYKVVHIGDKQISVDSSGRTRQSWIKNTPKYIYEKLFGEVSLEDLKKESLFMQGLAGSYKNESSYNAVMDEINRSFELRSKWLTAPLSKPSKDESSELAVGDFYTSDVHKRGYPTPLKQYFDLVSHGLLHKRGQIFVVSNPIEANIRIGSTVGFHSATHGNGLAMKDVLAHESYIIQGVNDFITDLKEKKLLDDTMVLLIGGMNNAGAHIRHTIPTILFGGGFKHQGMVQCQEKDKMKHELGNIYVSVLHQMGIDVDEFATVKGNVDKIIL